MVGLEQYDIKLLLALQKSIEGRKDFFKLLATGGYPQLAAFSNAIRADVDAMKWLASNGFLWLAALSDAIDGVETARKWVKENLTEVNYQFALACREEIDAIVWLKKRDLEVFLMMAKEVHTVLDTQAAENAGPYVFKMNN
ncbi:MAG: hypothetical protein MJZ51_02410 [Bacteroidales bacterium]|nr:hypothetical protein [Bacteroidales bacterium]